MEGGRPREPGEHLVEEETGGEMQSVREDVDEDAAADDDPTPTALGVVMLTDGVGGAVWRVTTASASASASAAAAAAANAAQLHERSRHLSRQPSRQTQRADRVSVDAAPISAAVVVVIVFLILELAAARRPVTARRDTRVIGTQQETIGACRCPLRRRAHRVRVVVIVVVVVFVVADAPDARSAPIASLHTTNNPRPTIRPQQIDRVCQSASSTSNRLINFKQKHRKHFTFFVEIVIKETMRSICSDSMQRRFPSDLFVEIPIRTIKTKHKNWNFGRHIVRHERQRLN